MSKEFFVPTFQLGLPDIEKTKLLSLRLPKEWESLKEIATARKMVMVLTDLLPSGAEISYVVYDYVLESEIFGFRTEQMLNWLRKEAVGFLLLPVSKALNKLLKEENFDFSCPMVAIGSPVKIRGQVFHIPQMDFVGRTESLDSLETLVAYVLGPGRWILVDSGASYHTWGAHCLLSSTDWRSFMQQSHARHQSLLENFPSEVEIDEHFVLNSLSRGFSALRVHPLIEDKPPPKIIKMLEC